jgi:nitroreductase
LSYKKLVWRLAPSFAHLWLRNVYFSLRLLPEVWYHYCRYLCFSGINSSRGFRGAQAARIVMAYHQLEKGLSLAAPRPGFGKDALERLLQGVEVFIGRFGMVPPATTALGVVKRYMDFNRNAGVDMSQLDARLSCLTAGHENSSHQFQEGGTTLIHRAELETTRQSGFPAFFASRHSVRHFSGGEVPCHDLIDAVRLSQRSPSVCNRQAWNVHAYFDKVEMARLLAVQAGNRGFGDQATLLLLITCDLTAFVEVEEHYQAWIDGGMFCMSLCLAFHNLGYGTCCLNWSKSARDDRRLRQITTVRPEEEVIMMIAVGTLPERFNVACSPRRPLDEVLHIH